MDVTRILNRYNALKSARDGYWLAVWREVRQYVMPTYSDYLTEGGARGQNIFDTTAIEARQRLAAGMYNWMAPPDKRWFELRPANDKLANNEECKEYFGQATKIVAAAMANSNWPTVLIQVLNNLACGIDGVVWCEDGGDESILNFRSFPLETVCYAESGKGRPDTLFREMQWTSRQLVQEFGNIGKLPENIISEANAPDRQDNKHKILHAVFPRTDRDPSMADNKNFAFADVYIDIQTKSVIYEGGFEEMPFAVCRFDKSDNESYGRGPGIDKLPDIKMLNRMRQAYITMCERQADPSYLVPDGSLVERDFNRDPGSLVIYKPDINGAKPEPLVQTSNLVKMYQDIESEREKIKIGFFWDIFDPLGDLKQITATEAEIRNDGKLIPFAPIAGNLHNELFRILIHRVFALCGRRGLLPAPPLILQNNPEYKVEFVSKIALAIRKIESMGWIQTEATIGNIINLHPEVVDNFDVDKIARDIATANGIDPSWLTAVRDRDAIRQAKQEAAMQQQAAQNMLAGAQALGNNLGQAPESGSPLDLVMKNQGV